MEELGFHLTKSQSWARAVKGKWLHIITFDRCVDFFLIDNLSRQKFLVCFVSYPVKFCCCFHCVVFSYRNFWSRTFYLFIVQFSNVRSTGRGQKVFFYLTIIFNSQVYLLCFSTRCNYRGKVLLFLASF